MTKRKVWAKAIKAAFPITIPVMMGYLFIGIAFGVLFAARGYAVWWAVLMSVCVYAGSMQFVAIQFFTPDVHFLSLIFMTLMVNIRHVFYGLSMLEPFQHMGKKKGYMIFSLTDETYSLLCGAKLPESLQGDGDRERFFFCISLLDQLYWIGGSLLGGIAGSVFTFNTTGIDFAMTALFVVIFVEQWLSQTNHRPALIGLAVSLICLLIFKADQFILPSMIGIVILLMAGRQGIEKSGSANDCKNAGDEVKAEEAVQTDPQQGEGGRS